MSEDAPEPVEAPDDLVSGYETSLSHIGSLPEVPMRRSAVDRAIRALDPEQAVWWLDQLVRGALWGRGPEMDAMLACADWLQRLGDEDYELLQDLFLAATDAERTCVLMLLRNPPPHRALTGSARLPEVRLPLDRDVSIGERRSLARGSNRQLLERLLLDPEALVIRNLLKNPNLRVADILVVASRRPTTPDLLREVAMATRWLADHRVREALVQNPYSATGLALKLLPTLHVQTLRRIRNAGDLHPLVHETATMLVELREHRTAPWKV